MEGQRYNVTNIYQLRNDFFWEEKMTTITKKSFGKTANGIEATLYTLKAEKLEFTVTDFGANIVSIIVPDASGKMEDIALGFDDVTGYEDNASFFGACVGPSANRIANAKFTINGTEYELAVNDGPNNLHSDFDKGFHKRMWNAEISGEELKMTLKNSDGELGFPGNLDVTVTYSVQDGDALKIHYYVTTDKPALINMTNHSYFNLSGDGSGSILDHVLQMTASRYTPVVAGAIPTGELALVAGTVFDFTSPRRIGDSINDDVEQLKLVQGYDHNWVIDNADGTVKKIAEVDDPASGRHMDVLSDQPGLQFYAGNCITPVDGKGAKRYEVRSGLCLETQVFPNSINEESFPNAVYTSEKPYDTVTIYKFSAK